MGQAPELTGDALAAVRHRGGHLQIIASAGSGKTEVVSQRVAELLAEGVEPAGIVAFTFTERAAAELRQRISERVEGRLGPEVLDRLGGLFVGTIHAFCFRLLQTYIPRYETFDVLDSHQLTALLAREATRLDLKRLDPGGRLFGAIRRFLKGLDVVGNELLAVEDLPDPFRSVLAEFAASLDRYRLLTFGQQIERAVVALARPEIAAAIQADLRHLIVDEYQDVNLAQERLIERLTGPHVSLCVVGDDDQAIYQWRGSDVGNITSFVERYPDVASFQISTNRRSRPGIVAAANRFAETIPGRLPKTMSAARAGEGDEVVAWSAATELEEAGWITSMILDAHSGGVPYRDMAVLVRSRAAYGALVEQFRTLGVPVQPGGRTGLFDQPEAVVLGKTFAWLTGVDWRAGRGMAEGVSEDELLQRYQEVFGVSEAAIPRLRSALRAWHAVVPLETRTADLVGEFYELLDVIGVAGWDFTDKMTANRLGTLARFSALLADYEAVRRRARPDADKPGEQVGGQNRGEWYYRNLAIHIVNYASGAYEDFDGEDDVTQDAVELTTVHAAKGLEWPVVFVPSMTGSRFPSKRTGEVDDWPLPRHLFPAARYEGSDADERRLFYVAMTRARDWLSISRHAAVKTRVVAASPYYRALQPHDLDPMTVSPPTVETVESRPAAIEISYSELATFLDCATAYRLRTLIGFKPRLAPELGYGKAVHHVLRTVADHTRRTGVVPGPGEIDQMLDGSFFLPTATKPAHHQLKQAARRLIVEYTADHGDDLRRVWQTERAFELHLDGVTVLGRADVILDYEDGVPTSLAILDYKTSTRTVEAPGLQLQVYTDAGRREGLDVRGAYLHDLASGTRTSIDVGPPAVANAERTVTEAANRLRARDFTPTPGPRCRRCEVRTVCPAAIR